MNRQPVERARRGLRQTLYEVIFSSSGSGPRQQRGALVVLAMALVFLLWSAVWVPVQERPHHPADFDNYHRAASALVHGDSPYSVHNFDYPPLLALLVVPLAGLPLPEARWVWLWLSQVALLAAGWGLWRALVDDGRLERWWAAAVVAASFAVLGTVPENLVLGQVHPAMLALLAWALALWIRRPAVAAGLIGTAAALKLWPALLLVPLAVVGRWRALAAGVMTAATLVAGPVVFLVLFLPPPAVPASSGFWMGTPAPLNLSLPALALRIGDWAERRPAPGEPLPWAWLHGHDPRVFTLAPADAAFSVGLSAVLLAAGLALVLARLRRAGDAASYASGVPSPRDERRAVAAIFPLVLATAPLVWYHYQLFLALPLVLLAEDVAHHALGPDRRRWLLLLALAGLTATASYSQRLIGLYHEHYGATAARPLLFLGLTALAPLADLAFLAWLLRRIGRVAPDAAR